MILSGLILRRIFDHNQQEFTEAESRTIPTIAVIEEAQSVLNDSATSAEPFIAWVKEGRKYDLGALLITQQPGSIPIEILSQGDNWFLFHLLSSIDLLNVQRANAHFSQDLLSALLNEPMPGQGVFWSSVAGKAYPVSLRVLSFESTFAPLDPHYDKPRATTFARELQDRFEAELEELVEQVGTEDAEGQDGVPIDIVAASERRAINALRNDQGIMVKLHSQEGCSWGYLTHFLEDQLPSTFQDRNRRAYDMVRPALIELFGPENSGWHTYQNDKKKVCVRAGRRP